MPKTQIKLWFDDARPAPDSSWVWAKRVVEAQKLFCENEVVEAALDCDIYTMELRKHGYKVGHFEREPQGTDLAKWMAANGFVPDKVTIHSWNPAGARRMAADLHEARPDAEIIVEPFKTTGGSLERHARFCGVWDLYGAGPCICGVAEGLR